MNPIQEKQQFSLSRLESSIIRTLMYFDIFNYPLQAHEIQQSLTQTKSDLNTVQQNLEGLTTAGLISLEKGYYYLGEERARINRRIKGNHTASERMPKARRISRLIGHFPFVRAVMISGSLSKNYMDEDSDIDFFIITQAKRLWIARTFLVLFKKVFLFNSHKSFCVNYFIDTHNLEIEDKNLFTATEVSFLLPTYNYPIYELFQSQNAWAKEFYPNMDRFPSEQCTPMNKSVIRRFLEWCLSGSAGEKLDTWFMKKTLRRWQQKFSNFDKAKFEIALRTQKHVSKHHPSDFQNRVIKQLAEKKSAFESKFKVQLKS